MYSNCKGLKFNKPLILNKALIGFYCVNQVEKKDWQCMAYSIEGIDRCDDDMLGCV